MKSTLVHVARALINILELGLNYTSRHSRQVAGYAALLAGELGVPKKEMQRIYLAGLLHDIGKLGIPSDILCKQGKLNAGTQFDPLLVEIFCRRMDYYKTTDLQPDWPDREILIIK